MYADGIDPMIKGYTTAQELNNYRMALCRQSLRKWEEIRQMIERRPDRGDGEIALAMENYESSIAWWQTRLQNLLGRNS